MGSGIRYTDQLDSIGKWFNEIGNPQFIDPASGNYYLKATSPAIYFCFSKSDLLLIELDVDGDIRGWDWVEIENLYGPYYDLGFDEYNAH